MRKFDTLDKSWDMTKRTKFYRNHLERYADGEAWKKSLTAMGNCCHLGPIDPSAISRIAVIDRSKQEMLCFQAMDPTISIMNYQIIGKKYRGFSKWIFGEDLGEDAPRDTFGSVEVMKELALKWGISEQHAEAMRFDYILPENRDGIKILHEGAC